MNNSICGGYYPYRDLSEYRDSEYFEAMFLDYYEKYLVEVEKTKTRFANTVDDDIERIARDVVRLRNDEEIKRIFNEYRRDFVKRSREDNEQAIAKLKKDIRLVKDIILMTEPTDMKRLQKIDKEMGALIDSVSLSLGITDDQYGNGAIVSELLESYSKIDVDDFRSATVVLKDICRSICDYYRKNFSVKTATKYINSLKSRVDKLIERKAISLGILEEDERLIDELVNRYNSNRLSTMSFEEVLKLFKDEVNELKINFFEKYTDKMAKKLIKKLDKKAGMAIDRLAYLVGYPDMHEMKLKEIFSNYKPDELDIFDISLYSSEEARDIARERYIRMSLDEQSVFEMKMYEQYIRVFKGKIRELNRDVRRVYSDSYADDMVASFNRMADDLICNKAREIGKPIPKNPWFIRKYLWADPDNFLTDEGITFRKAITPVLRQIVKMAMDNKLIIEERPILDPTKNYVFVSTHYFTEDIIGLFASIDRQTYMLMGTTDQIENNPLMAAAIALGLFYVDREDLVSRRECVEKQNRIIEHGTSLINYVGGSWENSENELQPLSFSGPYKTAKAKDVQIVPVASYLVREDKTIYVRYGEPMDLSKMSEMAANEVIRDTLASMHFKQICKHSKPIDSVYIDGYGLTHNLPYDQHTYYMDQVGNEYWNQFWSKPFAAEEIGLRARKVVTEEEVYSFIDSLSRDKLIELSSILAEPLLRIDEKDRYNLVSYLDRNYDKFRKNNTRKKVKKKEEE